MLAEFVLSRPADSEHLMKLSKPNRSKKLFEKDLVQAFLKEGIPLHKLENGPLRDLLDKYCTHKIPSVSTLRRTVLYLHEENLIKVREEIGEAKIWMSIDEATDSLDRNIANVVIGKLVGDCAGKGFLIHVSELEKTNASTIVETVQEALRILWNGAPEKTDKLLYLVTDSAAYMLKAGKILKMLYPKLLHSTCLSHGLSSCGGYT